MRSASVFVLALALGCHSTADHPDGGTAPPPARPITAIVVAPETVTVRVGAAMRLTVTARDATGSEVTGGAVTWTSADTGIATVDASGVVTGHHFGGTRVSATIAGINGSADISVLYPPKGSARASANDTVNVRVGNGSTVEIPPGALPAGTLVSIEEVPPEPPPTGAESIGNGISIRVGLPGSVGSAAAPLGAAVSIPWPRVNLHIRQRISQSIDIAGNAALVVVQKAGDAATRVAVRAEAVAERADAAGHRIVDAIIIMPVIRGTNATYDFVAQLVVTNPVCFSTAWDFTRAGASSSTESRDRIAVVLVHGWQFSQLTCGTVERYSPLADGETWSKLVPRIIGDPRLRDRLELWSYRYPTFYSIEESAQRLGVFIRQQLAGRDVIVVAHSMGGLVAAQYATTSFEARVREILAIGTPFGGSVLADRAPSDIGVAAAYGVCTGGTGFVLDVFLGHRMLDGDGPAELSPHSAFLRALGASSGQIGPLLHVYAGSVGWSAREVSSRLGPTTGWPIIAGGCLLQAQGYSPSDGIVPIASATAFGAREVHVYPGLDHIRLPQSPAVVDAVGARLVVLAGQIPTAPRAIRAFAGDRQTGRTGTTLLDEIVVRVTDAANVPVPGVQVRFAAQGGGSVATELASTDASGFAKTTWTLGSSVGLQTASATTPDIPGAVTFTATATSNATCGRLPISVGVSATRRLDGMSCVFGGGSLSGSLFDAYELTVTSPITLRVTQSASVPPALAVHAAADPSTWFFGFNAPGSELSVSYKVMLAPGRNVFAASTVTAGQRVTYTLSTAIASGDITRCEDVMVGSGVSTDQTLSSSDCFDEFGTSDHYFIGLVPGATLTVQESSTAFDALLRLRDSDGNVIAFDDDGGGGTDARLEYVAGRNAAVRIDASSLDGRSGGSYHLRFDVSYPAGSAVVALQSGVHAAGQSIRVQRVP